MIKDRRILNDAQLGQELEKCLYCEEKPCKDACPAHCSPADFIMAAKAGKDSDIKRSALAILKSNPLGGICGITCPDTFCMGACTRKDIDKPVNIPAVQTTLVEKFRKLEDRDIPKVESNGKKVAVVGAGPAGISSVSVLARLGYKVTLIDNQKEAGGACNLIPDERLPRELMKNDIDFVIGLGDVETKYETKVADPEALLKEGYDAVILSTGEPNCSYMGIDGEDKTISFIEYLANPDKYKTNGAVAIVGGGAVALDCAATAKHNGASQIEMFVRRTVGEMRLTSNEFAELLEYKIDVSTRTVLEKIQEKDGKFSIDVCKTMHANDPDRPTKVVPIPNTTVTRDGYDYVIMAVGSYANDKKDDKNGIFYAGDCEHGGSTVVEAVASGKNAAANVHKTLFPEDKRESIENPDYNGPYKAKASSYVTIDKLDENPVDLSCEFFGMKIENPFLLSAAPQTDGYEQCKLAYEAGWAGVVMKTSFETGPIHIPNKYMHRFDKDTYGNCDNVSGHLLDRVTKEVAQLRAEFPNKLTMASTGGPVTGNDEEDKKGWQANTLRLEKAGAMAVEYSLSCPQGGDGNEGDIVSQSVNMTKKVVGWVMEISDPNVPKLFKLTGAVTSVAAIVSAIKEVFAQYPEKKGGITLANSFPVFGFREGKKKEWEEGIVFGMHGKGVEAISYLSLSKVHHLNMQISGNGGPMDYVGAANFLALGVKTVQFCTITTKYGLDIINELNQGLSFMLKERNIPSVKELIGKANKEGGPVTDFMDLDDKKMISDCDKDLCIHCGNCSRCPYLAIKMDEELNPVTDASMCIGCSICVQKCPSFALYMRDRDEEELKVVPE